MWKLQSVKIVLTKHQICGIIYKRDKILNIDVEYKNSASIFFYIQYILLGGLNHENL